MYVRPPRIELDQNSEILWWQKNIDDNKSMLKNNIKNHYIIIILNPIFDELDFKTALGRRTIILYIYIQNWGTY